MLIGQLRNGTAVGSGVTVTDIERLRHGFSKITLSTGHAVTLHKMKHVADLFIGHLPARSLRNGVPGQVTEVRVTSREWRGERDGKRGDRITVGIVAYDYR